MELRCYSYDGGAPPMDSWPLKEKMGVTSRAALHRPDQSYQATVAGFTLGNAKSWVGLVGHFSKSGVSLIKGH